MQTTPDYFDLDLYRMKQGSQRWRGFFAELRPWLQSQFGIISTLLRDLKLLPRHQQRRIDAKIKQLWRKYGVASPEEWRKPCTLA